MNNNKPTWVSIVIITVTLKLNIQELKHTAILTIHTHMHEKKLSF